MSIQDVLLIAFIALGAAVLFSKIRAARNRIKPDEARRLVEEGATLLDVRSPSEFDSGCLPGAKNVPLQDLDSSLDRLDREAHIVVYCRSGMRSSAAARKLMASGFNKVHDLGPMHAWAG